MHARVDMMLSQPKPGAEHGPTMCPRPTHALPEPASRRPDTFTTGQDAALRRSPPARPDVQARHPAHALLPQPLRQSAGPLSTRPCTTRPG